MVFSTSNGVYFSDLGEGVQAPRQILALLDVSHVDVLDEPKLLAVLSGECLESQL